MIKGVASGTSCGCKKVYGAAAERLRASFFYCMRLLFVAAAAEEGALPTSGEVTVVCDTVPVSGARMVFA